uniref:Uncharacterized protein n=1 Tax=Lepeophtheirus salmonis TaxID=72036 RepID=A0A0K2VEE1_LEPSM
MSYFITSVHLSIVLPLSLLQIVIICSLFIIQNFVQIN